MGYESRLYVAQKLNDSLEVLASIDLSKMGDNDFTNSCSSLFQTPTKHHIIFGNSFPVRALITGEGYTIDHAEDDYGEELHYAPISKVIAKLELLSELDGENIYRRIPLALNILRGIEATQSYFGELVVIHYGY